MNVAKLTSIDFLGSAITPLIARGTDGGFAPRVVIAFPGGGVHATGALGSFRTRDGAYRCATEYGKGRCQLAEPETKRWRV